MKHLALLLQLCSMLFKNCGVLDLSGLPQLFITEVHNSILNFSSFSIFTFMAFVKYCNSTENGTSLSHKIEFTLYEAQ